LLEVAAAFALGETTVHTILRKHEIARRPQKKKALSLEQLRQSAIQRFLSYVESSEADWCWHWLGTRDAEGYGLLTVEGQNRKAHRLSWEMFRGPIPDGLSICHDCPDGDFPGCVNPHHLFLGTAADNFHDAQRKGRIPVAKPRPPRPRKSSMRGERAARAKLTDAQAAEILERVAQGAVQRQLAAEFDVSTSAINNLVVGRAWRHLPREEPS